MQHVTRRNALAIGAASTLASACSVTGSGAPKRVAVVGAGIIGASIAFHCAKAGAKVTVLERGEIAGRASRGTFAWLNATWAKQPRHYHRFSQLAMSAWQELEAELDIPVKWGGSLEWFADGERQGTLRQQIAEQVEWGEPARMVPRGELAELEPKVDFGSTPDAALSPNDGAVDPVLAAQRMLSAAVALGAEIVTDCDAQGVEKRESMTVLVTSCGEFETDAYVLATGADQAATQRLAEIDLPQRSTPGVIVVTKPIGPLLNRILVAPGVHIHQRLDGRLVLGEQEGAPDTAAHATRLAGRPIRFPSRELAEQHADRILAIARAYLPSMPDIEVEEVLIGWRPLPLDGHPVVGFSPDREAAYIAIAHSGVTLAPLIGRLAAQEIVEGSQAAILAPYRPDRTLNEIRRY